MTNLKHKNYLSRPRRFGKLSQTNTWNLSRQTSEKVIGLAVELDENGKGLIDWAEVN